MLFNCFTSPTQKLYLSRPGSSKVPFSATVWNYFPPQKKRWRARVQWVWKVLENKDHRDDGMQTDVGTVYTPGLPQGIENQWWNKVARGGHDIWIGAEGKQADRVFQTKTDTSQPLMCHSAPFCPLVHRRAVQLCHSAEQFHFCSGTLFFFFFF